MSRMTLTAFLLAAPPAAGAAPPVSAERAMERYRETFQAPAALDCPRSAGDEIVVCARRDDNPDPNRLSLPLPAVAGARTPRAPGEAPTGLEAQASADACIDRCGTGGFSISINVIENAKRLKNVVESLLD